jgi:hypothetical protein
VDRPVDETPEAEVELNGQGDEIEEPAAEAEQLALPTFEGLKPSGATVSFSGSVNCPTAAEKVTFEDGDVYFLVKGHVSGVAHRRKSKVGLVRDQALIVEDIVRVDDFEAEGIFRKAMPTVEMSNAHRNDDFEEDGEEVRA